MFLLFGKPKRQYETAYRRLSVRVSRLVSACGRHNGPRQTVRGHHTQHGLYVTLVVLMEAALHLALDAALEQLPRRAHVALLRADDVVRRRRIEDVAAVCRAG